MWENGAVHALTATAGIVLLLLSQSMTPGNNNEVNNNKTVINCS
jgi:hypothetical protein